LLFNVKYDIFRYIIARTGYVRWNDDNDVRFVIDQHDKLSFYTARSLTRGYSYLLGQCDQSLSATSILNAACAAVRQQIPIV